MIPNNISTIRSAAMAEECTENSAATSSSARSWWLDHHHVHANSLSSWSNNTNTWNPQNPNSNSSSGDEDVSMSISLTNASNHSGLTVDSSRRLAESVSTNELIGETPSNNHLWNHVFLSTVGNNGELHNNQDVGGNLINTFSGKNSSTGLFDPACDYLKKMDNVNDGWEFTSSTPFNNFEKNFNGFNDNIFETERLTKLSSVVSNWSTAPPDPEVNGQFDPPRTCNISLSPTLDQYYSPSDVCYMKPTINRKLGSSYSSHDHDLKVLVNNEQIREADQVTAGNLLRRAFNGNGIGYQMGMNNGIYDAVPDVPCNNNGRNFADVLTFTNCFSNKPILKTLNLSDCKKQALQASNYNPKISTSNTLTRNNKRGQVLANEGKKKRSEENSDTVLKKPKHESSTVSSAKVQVPKAKLGDKITALQQIVSPFGKTDTASVLWEAIGYIKFLQEQVQLLSNPYMKTNAIKLDPWGGLDRKDRGEVKVDLKSRGLCLVPVSCTPQVYRENTGPDYLTPAYRGCLYR